MDKPKVVGTEHAEQVREDLASKYEQRARSAEKHLPEKRKEEAAIREQLSRPIVKRSGMHGVRSRGWSRRSEGKKPLTWTGVQVTEGRQDAERYIKRNKEAARKLRATKTISR